MTETDKQHTRQIWQQSFLLFFSPLFSSVYHFLLLLLIISRLPVCKHMSRMCVCSAELDIRMKFNSLMKGEYHNFWTSCVACARVVPVFETVWCKGLKWKTVATTSLFCCDKELFIASCTLSLTDPIWGIPAEPSAGKEAPASSAGQQLWHPYVQERDCELLPLDYFFCFVFQSVSLCVSVSVSVSISLSHEYKKHACECYLNRSRSCLAHFSPHKLECVDSG